MTPVCVVLVSAVGPDGVRRVLLGRKKRGFGTGRLVAPGGHLEAGETAERAAVRELAEETGLRLAEAALRAAATVRFRFPARPEWDLVTSVFTAEWPAADGVPAVAESEEIAPGWYPAESLPFEAMWADARVWVPEVLAGGRGFAAEFTYAADGVTVASHVVRRGR